MLRTQPVPLNSIRDATLSDIFGGPPQPDPSPPAPALVQALLRHIMAETISEGIINCLIVTNSSVANEQLTRIHAHLFARELPPNLPAPIPPAWFWDTHSM
jgi:hypothetical protein